MRHMRATFFLMLAFFLMRSGFAQPSDSTKLRTLIYSEEFKSNERQQLVSLPRSTLDELVTVLQDANEDIVLARSIAMIGIKFAQYEQELSEIEKTRYAEAAVSGCKRSPKTLLTQNLLALELIRHPAVAAFASSLLNEENEEVKEAADRLLLNNRQTSELKGPARLKPKPPSPQPPAASTLAPAAKSLPSTPVAEVAGIVAPIVDRKAPVWPWLVGVAALVVLVAFALKRRA